VEDCAVVIRGLIGHWHADPVRLALRGAGADGATALGVLAGTGACAAATVYAPVTDLAPPGSAMTRYLRQREPVMKAQVGDELIVKGLHVGDPDRRGVITEVRGKDGGPPYLVRWSDGHEISFFPSSDTVVEHVPLSARGQARAS